MSEFATLLICKETQLRQLFGLYDVHFVFRTPNEKRNHNMKYVLNSTNQGVGVTDSDVRACAEERQLAQKKEPSTSFQYLNMF